MKVDGLVVSALVLDGVAVFCNGPFVENVKGKRGKGRAGGGRLFIPSGEAVSPQHRAL